MEPKDFLKGMIQFQKTTHDHIYNTMVTVQDQAEKMVTAAMEKATWLPDDGKKVIQDWIDAYKNGRETFKSKVDENFDKVVSYLQKEESE